MKKFIKNVTYYDPTKAFHGYTLWCDINMPTTPSTSPSSPYEHPGRINLINMNGHIVHTWKTPYPTFTACLLENGNILAGLYTSEDPDGNRPGVGSFRMGGTLGYLVELDWDGNIVFSHKDLGMHHDFKKLHNGNYIYLVWDVLEQETIKKVRGGLKGTEHNGNIMCGDIIREVDPQGKVVWEWHSAKHMDFDHDIIGPNYRRDEWSHLNSLWVCEDGDLMSSSRFTDMAFKISRKTGEIIWRFGNAAYLDKETNTLELRNTPNTFGGQHDVSIIPSGLPGAGNMLCYDNGFYKFVSRAVEVDMNTNTIVWQSTDSVVANGRVSFSAFISGARRLPNGNTFICDGSDGRLYEVTKDREVVWEYNKPELSEGSSRWGIFRGYRYAPDYCDNFKTLEPITTTPINKDL